MPNRVTPTSATDKTGRLVRLLQEKRVLVAVGSGGVGKTTTAAAVAVAAARLGRRVAVLTIDPAKRLAQALGLEKMGNEPRPLPADLVGPGSVDAMMLETGEAFDDLVSRLVPDIERRERLLSNRLYQVIARHLGGTHEYMAVERLFELSQSGAYDLIVVDTPPSVNALDFLDAPERIASFFSERITRFFVQRTDEKKGIFQRLKDRAGDVALQLLGVALGETFIQDVQDFATAFQGLFTAFRERGLAVSALMSDPKTSFLVVTGADPVRVSEALDFARRLEGFGIRPDAFIANRVHLSAADTVALFQASHLKKTDEPALADLDEGALISGLTRAQQIRASLARRDREGLLNLTRAASAERLLVVPELDHEVDDRSAVEHLLSALGGLGPQGS